jgi:hypothetical protein
MDSDELGDMRVFSLEPVTEVNWIQEALELTELLGNVGLDLFLENEPGGWEDWFIIDGDSNWTEQELEMVQEVLENSFMALASAGLSGSDLFKGYKFRRFDGEYVHDRKGIVALVNHDLKEITLPDVAFSSYEGFTIYHELGHVVDSQLGRELSLNFQQEASALAGKNLGQLVIPDGFWLRELARFDREEAAADAFALWVTVNFAGMDRPEFEGVPEDTQHGGINEAIEQALLVSGEDM